MLWAAAPAAGQGLGQNVAPPQPAATATPDRETLLRMLAEEMTTRLVTALSIQARSHAAEVATLEYRLRQAEERLERTETARERGESAHREDLKGMRELLARAEAAVGGLGASQAAMKAALDERDQDANRLKLTLTRALGALAEAKQDARTQRAAADAAAAAAGDVELLRQQAMAAVADLDRARQQSALLAAERLRLAREADELKLEKASLQIDRDLAFGERDAMSDRLQVVALQVSQPQPASEPAGLETRALERLGQIEQFLSATGINVGKLGAPVPGAKTSTGTVVPPPLPVSRQGGRGGPFIPGNLQSLADRQKPTEASIRMERQLDRLERVERVLRVLPLGAPLQHYSFESGFGPRSDPFRKKAAIHEGVDLAAPMRTPLRATGPGTVVHAGTKAAYGKTVDIRHAGGLVTRYAHMADIKVRDGETVRRGDIVGLLGSTGRSTGPHVHYEVMVDGRPVDPVRFIGKK
ncbi:hypothetical protein STHU_19690 [Allostella humosa]|nr:hypothetical protein STHU_19690 [Stella humosa]